MNELFKNLIEQSDNIENAKIDGVEDTDQVILDKRSKKEKETEKAVKEGLSRLTEMAQAIEEAAVIQIKKYTDTFLYTKGDYNKNIFEEKKNIWERNSHATLAKKNNRFLKNSHTSFKNLL